MPAPEMNALVRVNGSRRIGAGHVMRCLVLAERLSARGVGVTFVADDFGDRVTDVIRERGYALRLFPASGTGEPWLGSDLPTEIRAMRELIEGLAHPLDWLIVDNYGIDARWERALRPYARKIMVIDDLADRPHDCDVLLDQNECDDLEHRYVRLVAPSTVRFLGASYALLRREFIEAGRSLRIRDGRVRRILIAFGATDPTGETKKALRALRLAGLRDVAVDVVVGRWAVQAVDDERVELDCPVRFHHDVGSLAPLMVAADLAIGAGGTATWERAYLGLPTIALAVAENQSEIVRTLARRGIVWTPGSADRTDEMQLARLIRKALDDPPALAAMAARGRALFADYAVRSEELIETLAGAGERRYAAR